MIRKRSLLRTDHIFIVEKNFVAANSCRNVENIPPRLVIICVAIFHAEERIFLSLKR